MALPEFSWLSTGNLMKDCGVIRDLNM